MTATCADSPLVVGADASGDIWMVLASAQQQIALLPRVGF
jgi:hypothetical protein